MNRIPKSKIRHYIPPPFHQNNSQRDNSIDNPKISNNANNIKFYVSRNFGKDITNKTRNNVQNRQNNSLLKSNTNNNNNKSIYIKMHSSATSIADINYKTNNENNNTNKLGGFVSRNSININNNKNKSNHSRQRNSRAGLNKELKLNTKTHNSISYGNSNNILRPYTTNTARNNTNMISVRVSKNTKSKEKKNTNNNNNQITIKANNTNIISYIDKRKKLINAYPTINAYTNSNKDLMKHVNSINNKESLINSMNNNDRTLKPKNEYTIKSYQITNKENIDINNINNHQNKTEYKVSIIQYDNNTRTRRSNKSDIKIDFHKKEKEKEKMIYFDESKINNVQIPKDYINTIYYNLLREESATKMLELKANKNFMTEQKDINAKMRSILIDWLIDVHFKFGFTDETLFLTVSIIDRYISISQISRSNFQLLGITALMIACKHEEIDLPKIDDFIYITDHAYVKNEVLKMEYDVLNKLDFSFLYPSPIKFYEYLSIHFNFDKKMHMMGKYLMETFLLDVKNFKYKPSIIACACAYIVMKFFKINNYNEAYDKKFYNLDSNEGEYTEGNVKDCAREICMLVDNINKSNFQACVKKYSKTEQEKVAILIMNN